jgi:PhnB protein
MTMFNVYLNFDGNAEEAIKFYESVFGGKLSAITRLRDMPMPGVTLPKAEADKVMHVGLPVGQGQTLMASDVPESMGRKLIMGNNVYISLHPDSKAEADRLFTALSKGGEIEMAIAVQPWGDYYGSFKDKFGVHWMINYHEEK